MSTEQFGDMRTEYSKSLIAVGEQDPNVVVLGADTTDSLKTAGFGKKFPDRMFDVGIAEQHAVTFAAGLATEGYKPFAAIYSTFLQRAYDQVVHDVAIQNLPVRFAIDRAGLVGADGPTHAGSFDVTYLSTLPNFVVMAASDEAELVRMINTSVKINDRPSAFRYPRGNGVGVKLPDISETLEIGKGRIIKSGKKAAILNFGARLEECKKASEILSKKGIDITIIDARFSKPLDEKLIMDLLTWMHKNKADYTNTFCFLMNENIQKNKIYNNQGFISWKQQWQERLKLHDNSPEKSLKLMSSVNPLVIARNHKVEEVLKEANNGNLNPFNDFLKVLEKPYEKQAKTNNYQFPAQSSEKKYQTFCGT